MVALVSPPLAASISVRTNVSYAEAVAAVSKHALPSELASKTPSELEAAWPEWLSQHDAQIRARVVRGDEDSLANFVLYGTSFTPRSRASRLELAKADGAMVGSRLIHDRIEDFIAAIAAPGTNERLQFARQVIERQGINVMTPAGKDQARRYLGEVGQRMLAELVAYRRTVEAIPRQNTRASELTTLSTIYRDRGLSSDTTLLPDFAVHQTLEVMQSRHVLMGPIRRIAIVGPGLDFADKADGYDFYPVQTIQPFAVIDSVIRLGLGNVNDLSVYALDINPRVIAHLEAARSRANDGTPYTIALPLDRDENWNPALLNYWKQFGNSIGVSARAIAAPANAGTVTVRAVDIPPTVVDSVVPEDVNVVVQRLVPRSPEERFDLVIATNILSYYGVFDQSLALLNIESMLRPGGFLLSNAAMLPETPFTRSGGAVVVTYSLRQSDHVFWYQRH
jgi:hypothetical protein